LLTSYFGYTWLTKPSEQQPNYPYVAFQSEYNQGLLVDGLAFSSSDFVVSDTGEVLFWDKDQLSCNYETIPLGEAKNKRKQKMGNRIYLIVESFEIFRPLEATDLPPFFADRQGLTEEERDIINSLERIFGIRITENE
ncbi:7229_t:CDS:2, partial [Scutellospora calospora]